MAHFSSSVTSASAHSAEGASAAAAAGSAGAAAGFAGAAAAGSGSAAGLGLPRRGPARVRPAASVAGPGDEKASSRNNLDCPLGFGLAFGLAAASCWSSADFCS